MNDVIPKTFPLLHELEVFNKIAPTYTEKEGFLVIKGDESIGVYSSQMDGVQAGIAKWGNVNFLVRSLNPQDHMVKYIRHNFRYV